METLNSNRGRANHLGQEFLGSNFGDHRLERRLSLITNRISMKPAESFPVIFSEESELEGFYRFLSNPRVSWGKIIEPHYEQTRNRAAQAEEILIIHDSSKLQFQRKSRGDLGFINKSDKKQKVNTAGFLCHFSFAVLGTNNPEPLGVLNVRPLRRLQKTKNTHQERHRAQSSKTREKYESSKWLEGVKESRRRVCDSVRAIHVMDREADYYALMADMVNLSERFVIRVSHEQRSVENGNEISTISQALSGRPTVCDREIFISKRTLLPGEKPRKGHSDRASRTTRLSINAACIEIKRSVRVRAAEYPKTLPLNVVHIFEANPPAGETPIDWKLFTTEPIQTEEQILKIVDIYRTRWTIEEFFKALKTGCSYGDRQLESFKTVMNELALMLPVAWQMLLLRHHSRLNENERANRILNPTQLAILIALKKGKLTEHATSVQALYAIASLGGHIKNNGAPGWLVIYRGLRELHAIERGVNLNVDADSTRYVIND